MATKKTNTKSTTGPHRKKPNAAGNKARAVANKAQKLLEELKGPELADNFKAHFQKGLKWDYKDPATGRATAEFEVTDVDPSMAAMFLANMRRNRKMDPNTVRKYVSDLENNRWVPNMEAMWLDSELRLGDGQHRCAAIVESGRTMPGVLVAIAHDDRIFSSLDQGRVRTMENIQDIAGDVTMNRTVSGAVILEHNDFKSYKRGSQSIAEKRTILRAFSRAENGELLRKCNELKGRNRPVTAPALAVAIRTLKNHRDRAFDFWLAVFSNNAIINGDYCPQANVLSSWLYANGRRTGEAARKEALYRCIYAWNNFLNKKVIKVIKYSDTYEIPDIL